MKKTLAVLMAALLACACFATIGSAAATPTASLDEGYTNVTILNNVSLDKLFDGVKAVEEPDWLKMTADQQKEIVAFCNADCKDAEANATLALQIDLGEEKTLSAVTVSFYKCYTVMIGLGVSNTMTISTSTDGKTYTEVQDFEFDSEPAVKDGATNPINGVVDEEFKFDSAVTTRYLELKLPYEASDPTFADGKVIWEFIAMTEIAFTEGTPSTDTSEPADDESKAESVATSEAPSTSSTAPTSSTTESSKTPVTGDAGLAAIAVIAVIALAGTVVVARKRG